MVISYLRNGNGNKLKRTNDKVREFFNLGDYCDSLFGFSNAAKLFRRWRKVACVEDLSINRAICILYLIVFYFALVLLTYFIFVVCVYGRDFCAQPEIELNRLIVSKLLYAYV